MSGFPLHGELDLDAARDRLTRDGRVRAGPLFTEDAVKRIHAAFESPGVPWRRSTSNPADLDVPLDWLRTQAPEDQAAITAHVHAGATDGFQYAYDRFRIDQLEDAATHADEGVRTLSALHGFLTGPDFLAVARRITGDDRISDVDAHATRYDRGHFLNRHDDYNARVGRLYAYVINLSPRWRPEWGGLLMFLDGEEVTDSFLPKYNVLNVFSVPVSHAVSMVAPFAGAPRYSITGWFKSLDPTTGRPLV